MKSGVKFGHKICAVRMCTLGRGGPWRSGLTSKGQRNTVKMPSVCRAGANHMLTIRVLNPWERIPKGTCDVTSCRVLDDSCLAQPPMGLLRTPLLVAKHSSGGAMGIEGKKTMTFITHPRNINQRMRGNDILPTGKNYLHTHMCWLMLPVPSFMPL